MQFVANLPAFFLFKTALRIRHKFSRCSFLVVTFWDIDPQPSQKSNSCKIPRAEGWNFWGIFSFTFRSFRGKISLDHSNILFASLRAKNPAVLLSWVTIKQNNCQLCCQGSFHSLPVFFCTGLLFFSHKKLCPLTVDA